VAYFVEYSPCDLGDTALCINASATALSARSVSAGADCRVLVAAATDRDTTGTANFSAQAFEPALADTVERIDAGNTIQTGGGVMLFDGISLSGGSVSGKATHAVGLNAVLMTIILQPKTFAEIVSETITLTKAALTHAGKAFTTNAKTQITMTKASVTHAGKAFTANMKERIALTVAELDRVGKAYNLNAKEKIALTKAALVLAGQEFTTSGAEAIVLTAAALTRAGKAFVVNAKTSISLTKAGLTHAGKPFYQWLDEYINIGAGTLTRAGLSFVGNSKTRIILTLAARTVVGKAWKANEYVRLTKAALVRAGKTFTAIETGAPPVVEAAKYQWHRLMRFIRQP
jgi:hypothetical protein